MQATAFILVLGILPWSISPSCTIGTISCDTNTSPPIPKICDFFDSYVLSEDALTCQQKVISNCEIPALPSSSRTCFKCRPHHVLDRVTHTCSEIPTRIRIRNCQYYERSPSVSCIMCASNYFLSDGQCTLIPSADRVPNCLVHSSPKQCILCPNGMYFNGKQCVKIKAIPNCHFHREVDCEVCGPGFYLNRHANRIIPKPLFLIHEMDLSVYMTQNFHFPSWHTEFATSPCLEVDMDNCISQENWNKCLNCAEGFYVGSKGKCVRKQYAPIKDCIVYLDENTCSECEFQFYLNENQCRQNTKVQFCGEYSKVLDVCLTCLEGYSLGPDQLKCNFIGAEVARVYNCNPSPNGVCDSCDEDKILSQNKEKCIDKIEHCTSHIEHDGEMLSLQCRLCEEGFTSNSIDTFCNPSSQTNCFEYSYSENRCVSCEASFIFDSVQSTSDTSRTCIFKNVSFTNEGCLANTTTFPTKTCDVCDQGYTLIQRTIAFKNDLFFRNCDKINFVTSKCLQCAENTLGNAAGNACGFPQSNLNGNCQQMKPEYFGENIENNCGKCKDSKKFYLENYKCVRRETSDLNCQELDEHKDSCSTCQSNFTPKVSGPKMVSFAKCSKTGVDFKSILNCEVYYTPGICGICKEGYSLSSDKTECRFAVEKITFNFEKNLMLSYPEKSSIGKVDKCEEYQQVEMGSVRCVKCQDGYVGIVPDMGSLDRPLFHLDSSSLSMKIFYKECLDYKQSLRIEKDHDTSSKNCESGMRIRKGDGSLVPGFVCIGCKPGFLPMLNQFTMDYQNNSIAYQNGVQDCSPTSLMVRKYKALGWHYKQFPNKLPLGLFLNFDSCKDTRKSLAINIESKVSGNLFFHFTKDGLFDKDKKDAFLCLSKEEISNWIPNCQVFLQTKSPEVENGCMMCKPGHITALNPGTLLVDSCTPHPFCQYDKHVQTYELCDQPTFGFESDSILSTLALKTTSGANPFCLVYDLASSSKCRMCKKGYFLEHGECRPLDIIPEFFCEYQGYTSSEFMLPSHLGNGDVMATHLFLEINFSFMSNKTKFCESCPSGFFLNNLHYQTNCEPPTTPEDQVENCLYHLNSLPLRCRKCKDDFILDKTSGTCVDASSFPNCLELENVGDLQCSVCIEGFVWFQGRCRPSNCALLINGKCNLCKDGFKHVKGLDYICQKNPYYQDDPCEAYSPLLGTCGKCKQSQLLEIYYNQMNQVQWFTCSENRIPRQNPIWSHYDFSTIYYIEHDGSSDPSTSLKFILDSDQSRKVYMLKKDSVDPGNRVCIKSRNPGPCRFGEYENEVDCKRCENNHKLNRFNKCVDGSISFCEREFNGECRKCEFGYYIDQGNCVKHSQIMYCSELDLNMDKCQTCFEGFALDNNGLCEQSNEEGQGCAKEVNGECVECEEEYLLEKSLKICLKRNAKNCKEQHPDLDECLSCYEGHFLDEEGDSDCEKYTTVDFCEEYFPNIDRCKSCDSNHFLENDFCKDVEMNIENCESYSNASTCTKCIVGYFLMENQCQKSDVSGCEKPVSVNECEQCDEDHYKNESNQCERYSPDLFCLEFSPDKDECLSCKSWAFINDHGQCTRRVQVTGCLKYVDSSMDCEQCQNDFWLDSKSQSCKIRKVSGCLDYDLFADKCSTCRSGRYLDDNGVCQRAQNKRNCEEYDAENDTCLKCSFGYFNKADRCVINPDGIEGCTEYLDIDKCKECGDEFFLSNRTCLKPTVKVENCAKYLNESECEECLSGYHLTSPSMCSKNTIENCEYQISSTSCKTCKSNHVLSRMESEVKCVPSNISNCLVAIGGRSTATCLQCSEGYIPSTSNTECIVPSSIPFCKEYESPDSCNVCSVGYIRSKDTCSCIPRENITGVVESGNSNCLSEIMLQRPVCSECKPGYQKNSRGRCVVCGGNGCAVCGEGNAQCVLCTEGFYMDGNGVCHWKVGGRMMRQMHLNYFMDVALLILLINVVK